MKVKIRLAIRFRDNDVANCVFNALQPDNVGLPGGLGLTMSVKGDSLMAELKSEARLETLIATVEGVLSDCQIAIETLEKIGV